MNKDKSAIDMIYEIFEKLESFDKKLTVIDNNIKLLNNKINKISNNDLKSPDAKPKAIAPNTIISAKPVVEPVEPKAADKPLENVKIYSRIKNKRKAPIKDIDVNIYNKEGKVIKTRVTDEEGYWEARVQPGEYGIEYSPVNVNKKLRPVNFKITVNNGIKELDISEINNL